LLNQTLTFGCGVIAGVPAFASAVSQPARTWNFGTTSLNWEPLELAMDDTLVVSAHVGGLPVQAVLDSGSGASIISTALAARLGLRGERRTISGLSARAQALLVRDIKVVFAGEPRRLPFAIVADLSATSAAFGRPIDMMLGADMFTESCIALDFGKRRLAVAKSGSFLAGPNWRRAALGRGAKQELFIRASVASLPLVPLMLDLGNSAPLILSADYLRDQQLLKDKQVTTAALGGVDGIRVNDVLRISDVKVEGLEVCDITTLSMRDWLSTSTVGNIGLPLIAQFDAVMDVTAGFVWLRPISSRHRIPMLKDRSGLGVAASPIGLAIVHVAANSPAEKAGWAIGDRIIMVNGRPIDADYTHGRLWRWRYGPAGTLVTLTMAAGDKRELRLADYY